MYKLLTLSIILFFISFTINAQNSKEEYENAVDCCACKIAYAYTEYFATKHPSLDENKSFNEIISKRLNDCDKKNISSSELKKLLTENNFNGFSKILIPDAKTAKKNYTDDLTKAEAINKILTSFKLSFDKIDIKEKLGNDLDNILQNFTSQGNIIEEKKSVITTESILTKEINHSERMLNENVEKSKKSFFPNWLLFVLILITSALLFLNNYYKNNKLKGSINRHRDEIEELKRDKTPFNQSINKNQINSRFERDVNHKISDLKKTIERLQKDSGSNLPSVSNQKNQVQNLQQTTAKETRSFNYAKTPISDKVFNASDVNESKEGKFYKFIMTNNNQVEFEFFNTENSAKRAVNAPDSFLYPACEEIEPLNQNAKKIITNKKGIVIKQDDKWIVKEKAQITYE